MRITEIIFSAILNVLSIYIDFRIIHLFLGKKKRNQKFAFYIYFFVWLLNWCVYYFFHNTYFTTASLLMLLMVAVSVLNNGSYGKKMVAVCSSVALTMAVEEIVWHLSYLFQQNEAIGSMISIIISNVLVLFLERCFRFDREKYISKDSYVNITIILLSNIVFVYILAKVAENNQREILIALSVICLIDISTFYLYDKVNEVYQQRLEHQRMEERIFMYENQFKIVEQSQKNMSTLYHDMKNHLYLIKSYLSEENYKEAQNYIKEIETYMKVSGQYVDTGNRDMDIILNYALERAKKISCKVETQITIPDNSFLPGFDLNMLLGNLLDNALEALEKVEERFLYIGISFQKGMVLIRIWNSYDGKIYREGEAYETRKKDKLRHGIGLKNIKEVVEKYNGNLTITTTKELFKIDIVLYIR